MLKLRQMAQPLLDKYGFTTMHVGAEQGSLALKGTCGKIIVIITGVAITAKPTKDDRGYALELLVRFIEVNLNKLKAFIKVSNKVKEAQEMLPIPDGYEEGTGTNSLRSKLNNYSSSTIVIREGFQVSVTSHREDVKHLISALQDVDNRQEEFKKYFDMNKEYLKLKDNLLKVQNELFKCDI